MGLRVQSGEKGGHNQTCKAQGERYRELGPRPGTSTRRRR
jgi:hypothetical protein